ncbi:hypothetical protein DFJ58DRAFT_736005 [Suillus subalutaceus]|uniref:uncharacterized protein n=1 Tax=Suillus subalutaceus TaxID=48586 RepID=UPI001B8617EB|nr:uncharacterized protein DFJ58DRAFT_736005 [Suillus subalutaceus]KAG1833676.1 hypothetical protein DFJ58DRAFT_736005 [Suillus subalutaceus]
MELMQTLERSMGLQARRQITVKKWSFMTVQARRGVLGRLSWTNSTRMNMLAEREQNQYFPFASKPDWEMASYILRSDLSMAEIDEYLNLEFTKTLPCHFALRENSEDVLNCSQLPLNGSIKKSLPSFQRQKPFKYFIGTQSSACSHFSSHPLLAASFDFIPCKVYESAERAVRVYHGFMTGDHAWNLQKDLPEGASLLGVVLSSDKTKVSNIAGNRYTHPLLVSLANIDPGVRAKGSLHAVYPTCFASCCKVLAQEQAHAWGSRRPCLLHQCIDLVVEPLKQAARLGVMMSDPRDTPEELVIACATMNSSPVTMATREDFGDPIRHPPRDGSSTPCQHCSDYNIYLTFRSHPELAYRKSLPPSSLQNYFTISIKCSGTMIVCTGYRAFKEGISALKQATGRDHRNVQPYIVGVIAGAAPADFISAIRALMDIQYNRTLLKTSVLTNSRMYSEHRFTIPDMQVTMKPTTTTAAETQLLWMAESGFTQSRVAIMTKMEDTLLSHEELLILMILVKEEKYASPAANSLLGIRHVKRDRWRTYSEFAPEWHSDKLFGPVIAMGHEWIDIESVDYFVWVKSGESAD